MEDQTEVEVPRRAAHLTLALLAIVGVLNAVDRQVLSVLMEPIKRDLSLSDTALGAVSGTAFAIFYATAAFPLARWADRGDRGVILSVCLAGWSLATALCGAAQTFFQLTLARIGVAVGEASCMPTSQSLATDLYPATRRALVIAVINASSAVGTSIGFAVGGLLASYFPWRHVFAMVGLPGLLVAAAMFYYATEPRRARRSAGVQAPTGISFLAAVRIITSLTTLRWLLVVVSTSSITGYGLLIWGPSFFMRVHHLTIAQTGMWVGLATVAGLSIGALAAGIIGDRLARRDVAGYGKVAVGSLLLAIPAAIGTIIAPSPAASIFCYFLAELMLGVYFTPVYAMAFAIVPGHVRALTSAVLSMFVNLAGIGLGPLVIGWWSDLLTARFGDASLRYSMLGSVVWLLVGAAAAFMATRSVRAVAPGGAAAAPV